jgi:Family of unknown function (DUF5675)
MPITGTGWEILIERVKEERRGDRVRTRGKYQVFHDGVSVAELAGSCVETRGPGDNSKENNGKRIEQGRYPLGTHVGERFATINFAETGHRPAVKLNKTNKRTDILIHPASGFKSTIGCINLSRPLANTNADMDPADSRRRVIVVIDDLKSFLGNGFPKKNDQPIARAFAVIEGEPSS